MQQQLHVPNAIVIPGVQSSARFKLQMARSETTIPSNRTANRYFGIRIMGRKFKSNSHIAIY